MKGGGGGSDLFKISETASTWVELENKLNVSIEISRKKFNMSAILLLLIFICIKWIPGDHSNLATIFAQKMPECSGSMYSSILMLENIWHHHFSWSGPNSQEIVNLFQFSSGLRGRTIGIKFTISGEFGPLQAKWCCHMFSNLK